MSTLKSADLSLIGDIFRGGDKGYVLDFSNRTFADFFARELNIDIDAPVYAMDGTSKGKRLRRFLAIVDDGTAANALQALWEHRQALCRPQGAEDRLPRAGQQISGFIARLRGTAPERPENVVEAPQVDLVDFAHFHQRLLAIRDTEPHQRGYDFERFLTDVFEAFRLKPREPFRLVGEQIDGSFELAGEIYLIEAKWLNRKVGVAELHGFHGKVEQKAGWTRGVFVSFGGFTEEGLTAFGRGKRVIGLDGRDLHEALKHGVAIDALVARKVRHAAETGEVFAAIERLFPLSA